LPRTLAAPHVISVSAVMRALLVVRPKRKRPAATSAVSQVHHVVHTVIQFDFGHDYSMHYFVFSSRLTWLFPVFTGRKVRPFLVSSL
jgi:hypothetical protein